MIPESVHTMIYECYWGAKRYVYGKSEKEAYERLIHNCAAYGDPENEDDARYMLGTKWVEEGEEEGWRIESREVNVQNIYGTIYGSFERNERVHYYWQCPQCKYKWGEDLEYGQQFPRLVYCGHKKNSGEKESFYLVHLQNDES